MPHCFAGCPRRFPGRSVFFVEFQRDVQIDHGLLDVAQIEPRQAAVRIHRRVAGAHIDHLVEISFGLSRLAQPSVRGAAIVERRQVLWIAFDGLRKVSHGFLVIAQ